MKTQGRFGMVSDSHSKMGENVFSRPLPNDLKNIIPDGTSVMETSQAIITPSAISIPNS